MLALAGSSGGGGGGGGGDDEPALSLGCACAHRAHKRCLKRVLADALRAKEHPLACPAGQACRGVVPDEVVQQALHDDEPLLRMFFDNAVDRAAAAHRFKRPCVRAFVALAVEDKDEEEKGRSEREEEADCYDGGGGVLFLAWWRWWR